MVFSSLFVFDPIASSSEVAGDQGEMVYTPQIEFDPIKAKAAREIYPPDTTRSLLKGDAPAPEGFDSCMKEKVGSVRLSAMRAGAEPSGIENDLAALCLMEFEEAPESMTPSSPTGYGPETLTGWFTSGQEADIMLSGFGFNDSGGPLAFNHPKGIATDGVHLLLADGNNNRVLIWNQLPSENTPPDVVLGQPDFYSNSQGTGHDQMNWPVSVSTDGTRVVVADTYNDRILIWNQFPTENGASADIVLDGSSGTWYVPGEGPSKSRFYWPWGVWTNGEKLVVTSTHGGYALIWNEFPQRDDQPADLYITAGGNMGTPRTITSDGTCLIIGDHNAENTVHPSGDFFWDAFPTTDDEPCDFFRPDPLDPNPAWLQGGFTEDGKLVMLGSTLHIWNSFPEGPNDWPDISISGFGFVGGDGAGLAVADDRIYISLYNGNRVVVYNTVPTRRSDKPDFAIGSPDIHINTLDTRYSITNGVPATDGKSLFVSSDFDKKLYIWKQIPDVSGAYPDLVYRLEEEFWDNSLWGEKLALAGRESVVVWNELPVNGQQPDSTFRGGIGKVYFKDLKGVALDDKYFYLSDFGANKVYVWEGVPGPESAPSFVLPVDGPWRLSSDGEFLAVTSIYNRVVYLYRVEDLSENSKPSTVGGHEMLNVPQNAILSGGSLFIADTGYNRVHIWKDVTKAIDGKDADVILGQGGPFNPPTIGADGLFFPAGLAFDGSYLWVGEYKFSFRLLRFSIT